VTFSSAEKSLCRLTGKLSMCVHDCLLPLKAANIVSFLTPQRSESGQRNGEDSLTDRCRQQPERAWQRLSIHCSSVKSNFCSGLFTKS
jgi:hypothetical protein